MANTYTQIYMHIVFAVNSRKALINNEWKQELYKYMAGACKNRNHFVHAIGGTADHVHLLIGMSPTDSISQFVQSIKVQSSKWINDRFLHGDFSWQSGYGAFSYSKSLVSAVRQYIENQEEHHKHVSFYDELVDILKKAGVDYNPDYIMKGFV